MKRRLFGALLVALTLFSSSGQAALGERKVVSLCSDLDLDSASYLYVWTVGEGGAVQAGPIQRKVLVKTSGASTSVTANTATQAPFQGMKATANDLGGDELYFNLAGVLTARVIATKADQDNVTVDSNIDLSTAQAFGWRQSKSGTAATDGWFPVAGWDLVSIGVQLKQSDATSIDVVIECDKVTPSAAPTQVFQKNYTAYGCTATNKCDEFTISPVVYDRCRLGLKINTDTSDAGANLEKISAQVTFER